jgi:ligand-binding sensor domain-containing protein/two-component sensor histidine kinase
MIVPFACAEQLPMIVFSARDGLATTPGRIVVDSKGFVWFPGCEGLARFDGNGFRILTPADGLPGNCALDIFERHDGTYWVAAQDNLCLFDPRPDRKRFQCESPKLGAINTIMEDERGLWCGTDSGLWRRPPDRAKPGKFVRAIEPGPAGRSIAARRLLKDTRGDVWAATDSGLYRFRSDGSIDRWSRARGLAADLITAISETPGAIWASTGNDLMRFRFDPHTGEARVADRYDRSHGLPSSRVTDVHSWRGNIWAATFQGLARQLPSGRWESVGLDPSVSGLPLEGLASDRLGNLWVGTDGGGAARISGSGISSFSELDGLALRKVWAIFEDRNGDLMAITKDEDHYFLNRFDGYRFHVIRPNIPVGTGWGWSWSQIAVHSQSGDWWLATDSGLLRYRGRLDTVASLVGPESGLRTGAIFRVFESSEGAIWASAPGVRNQGLYRRNPRTGRFEGFDEAHGLPSLDQDANRPAAFAEDRAGQVWIGTLDGGLVRFRNGSFQQFPSSCGAPDQGVRALLVDHRGRLWIGSRRSGLLRVDDPSAATPVFSAYTKSSGLSSNTIPALAEDLAGRIYAASGSGIDRLDPATGRIRHFTTTDGLLPGEIRVAFRDRHGALWFGGDHGLIRIQPQEDRTEAPIVLVYSIRVNGETRPLSDLGDAEPAPLSLSPSERQVQVDFGGFRHDLLYQTRLSGIDQDWTPPSSARSVHYLSLAPGSYELSIRALTPEGRSSSRPAQIRFRIVPPIWQRWWFLLISVGAVAGIAYSVHRYRLAQAVGIERLRTRIASDLHDDIGSNLSVITGLSEVLRQQASRSDPQMTEPLSVIANVSNRSMDAMADIVWAIDPRKDHLRDLAQRMRRWANDAVIGRQIELNFNASSDDLILNAEMRREIFLVFKEAMHNVVRHSDCTVASIDLRKEGNSLVLEVGDNGNGFAPDQVAQGQGLASMQRRAARLGGETRIHSEGRGTRVVVRVPLRDKPRSHVL